MKAGKALVDPIEANATFNSQIDSVVSKLEHQLRGAINNDRFTLDARPYMRAAISDACSFYRNLLEEVGQLKTK